jgi:predicted enzyme related to lactoylglutathione lyase
MKVKQVLNRFYVHDIDKAIVFYEELCDTKCSNRFTYQQMNLEIARVDTILLICGSGEALEPFKETQATFLVDSITEYKDYLLRNGSIILRDLKEVPTGMNMTVKHPDGTIVEYVEHRT